MATKSLVSQQENDLNHLLKKKVFLLLMWGMFFLVIASLVKYFSSAQGKLVGEILFFSYYLLFLIAFIYFWKGSATLHRITSREKILLLGMICLILVILGYFFTSLILPVGFNKVNLEKVNVAAQLLFISGLFLSTYVVHSRVRARIIDRSLSYISSGVFIYFVGYLIYTYVYFSNSSSKMLLLFYNILFLLSSGYYLLGFWVARKKN